MSQAMLILALLGILSHVVEQKNETKEESHNMTFEIQISNRKQIVNTREMEGERNKKRNNLHFSDNNVPRNLFNAFTGEKQMAGWEVERDTQTKETNKKKSF